MLDHDALAEKPGQNPYRRVRDRVAMQIIHEDAATAGPPHFPQYLSALGIGQMVKGERTDHRIERLVWKREPHSIADNRLRPLGPLQSLAVDIERDHSAVACCRQRVTHVAAAGRNIEDGQVIPWRKKSLDCPNTSKPSIDQRQLAVGLIEFRGGSREIVHELRDLSTCGKVMHRGLYRAPARNFWSQSQCNWRAHNARPLLVRAKERSQGHSLERVLPDST